jgi:tetratricopeptide (TPR) repeat protein
MLLFTKAAQLKVHSMNKDNLLFGIIGILLGLIIGFFFANSVIQRGLPARGVSSGQAELPPDHPAIPMNGAADKSGMQPAVKAAIERADKEPDNLDAQMQVAQMYSQIQQFDQAILYLTRANKIQPDNYQVIVALGNSNFDSQNYDAAEKWYSAALAKKPDDVDVLTDHGLTYMFRAQPDYDRAISEFQKAIQIDPKHEQTLQDLVVAYTEKHDAKQAQEMLDKLVEVNPQNAAIPELRKKLDTLKGSTTTAPTKK